jgi:hypothetical protein
MNKILGYPGKITSTSLNYAGCWAEGLNSTLLGVTKIIPLDRSYWARKFFILRESSLLEYRTGYFYE